MAWDPESGQTFGEWARGGAPLGEGRTAEVIASGQTWATKDQVLVDTRRRKAVQDQLGNVVTHETTETGKERKHVRINLR
ncbi:hypothetical protein HS041_22365 [Planomonospora sp. ID67723]|uniref:hypothetical protein n=1 Tax=Planomonospora sp. ID67723 TaxID=2738134 RepID=UPI0018C35A63|nr:hypothetical protein [Planomonospora sp. ID67723]MBG0830509.1 hypothetical protein [Planomonospora sp. ID67723]